MTSVNQSQDWIKAIDRGGLMHVNNMMYQLCVALELALRRRLCNGTTPNFEDAPNKLCQDENVQYYLSMVCQLGRGGKKSTLTDDHHLWVTICGFSYAGAWMEKYKASQHKSVQKSKGIRKQLYTTFPDSKSSL